MIPSYVVFAMAREIGLQETFLYLPSGKQLYQVPVQLSAKEKARIRKDAKASGFVYGKHPVGSPSGRISGDEMGWVQTL